VNSVVEPEDGILLAVRKTRGWKFRGHKLAQLFSIIAILRQFPHNPTA